MLNRKCRRVRRSVASAALGVLVAVGAVHGDSGQQLGATTVESGCGQACEVALSLARRATAKYHEEERALADGFVREDICVALPGVGAMGYHYPIPERMSDVDVDFESPEILLYGDAPAGKRRLIGLEYFAPVLSNGQPWMGNALEPPPVVDNAPPVLFGHTFQGPMPGHAPGMPWHYDLHVWAWHHNPAGTFSEWNPTVSCQ